MATLMRRPTAFTLGEYLTENLGSAFMPTVLPLPAIKPNISGILGPAVSGTLSKVGEIANIIGGVLASPAGRAATAGVAVGAGAAAGSRVVEAAARALGFGGAAAAPRRRRKGITAANLKGFYRVCNLLQKVGMVPKFKRRTKRPCLG